MTRKRSAVLAATTVGVVFAHVAHAAPAPIGRLAIPFLCDTSASNTHHVMVDIDSVFARARNDWRAPEVARVIKFECYPTLGRDESNAWVMITYGSTPAWLPRSAVRFRDGTDITNLPVVTTTPTLDFNLPIPLPGLPTITPAMRQMYQRAVRAGRQPNMISVVGDCNVEHPVLFGRIAAGAFDYYTSPRLRQVAQRFMPAFQRLSLATSGSFNAAMPFDSTWSDPKSCNSDEGPLPCELRNSNASILLVAIGTGDTFLWRDFEKNYSAIIEYALSSNVVPMLMTKADELESRQGGAPPDYINNAIRRLGARYGVPVIDFARAARLLPNNGLATERNDDLKSVDPFHVNGHGADARIWMLLQTLANLTDGVNVTAPRTTPTRMPNRTPTVTPKPVLTPTLTPRR